MTTFHPGGGGSSLTSADNSIPCHAELVSASHNKEIPQQVRDDKSHFPRPQGRGIKGEGLLHRPDCKLLKQVQDDKNFGSHRAVNEAHSKELNVLTSYRLNDFKKKAGATHVDMSGNIRRVAFTLAEVLITLAIIGVVAAMTIPTLIANYQERAWNTASLVFQRKLGDALTIMNSQGTLAGYSSTDDFVAELARHMKISKICRNDDLTSCFPDKVFWGNEEVDMTKVKTVKNFGRDDWENTDLIGAMFADGTAGLIAYNKDCKQDPYSNRVITISKDTGIGTDCLAVLYDTTGFKTPNTNLKDLRGLNVLSLAGNSCAFEINGTCFTAPFTPAPLTKAECEQLKGDLGIKSCFYDNYYWAGAVKACGGVSKMPTLAQLADIANYVYNTSGIGANEYYQSKVGFDRDKAAELGFTASSGSSFSVWSGELHSSNSNFAYYRQFLYSSTEVFYGSGNMSNLQAVCIGD